MIIARPGDPLNSDIRAGLDDSFSSEPVQIELQAVLQANSLARARHGQSLLSISEPPDINTPVAFRISPNSWHCQQWQAFRNVHFCLPGFVLPIGHGKDYPRVARD